MKQPANQRFCKDGTRPREIVSGATYCNWEKRIHITGSIGWGSRKP
jgi:hypothetical protein